MSDNTKIYSTDGKVKHLSSEEDINVKSNLIMHGYKVCNSCKISKTLFPI